MAPHHPKMPSIGQTLRRREVTQSLTLPLDRWRAGAIRRPSRRARLGMTWLLIATFLLQPILAYLVTPLVAQDANGQQVVICTLEGERVVDLALPLPTGGEDVEHCPALQLYQIAGAAPLPAVLPSPATVLYVAENTAPLTPSETRSRSGSAYSSRAPPAVA